MGFISRLLDKFSRKKDQDQDEEERFDAFISLYVDKEDEIFIDCGWRNDNESLLRFARLLYESNSGILMPEILKYLEENTITREEYSSIVLYLNRFLDVPIKEKDNPDSIVVKPTEVMGNILDRSENGLIDT